MAKPRVGITGAAGQVGSVLVRRMLDVQDFDVIPICRNKISASIIHCIAPNCDVRIGSITDQKSAKKLLGDMDVIYNCALAMISGNPKESRKMNQSIVENFHHVKDLKLLVHLSSISVYGGNIPREKGSGNTFERPKPENDYGRSKMYIERFVGKVCNLKGLNHYILRVGHVIGAMLDRSRQILESANDRNFFLPFDGTLPSNTIHVERLAERMIGLLANPVPSGIYNVAERNRTWRDVMDWHTNTVNLTPVKPMPVDISVEMMRYYQKKSIRNDIFHWIGSIPLSSLISRPAVFDFAFRVVGGIPRSISEKLATLYKLNDVRRQIGSLEKKAFPLVPRYYFSDSMPGRHLEAPSAEMVPTVPDDDLARQFRNWYQDFERPSWISPSHVARS